MIMLGIGVMEIMILLVFGLLGFAGLVGLFFVVRAAVRSGNRDTIESK